MTATSQYPAADHSDKLETTRVPEVRPRPIKPRDELLPPPEPSLGRRAFRALFRFLIAVGVGIGGTLAWQAYGDAARQMIATAYPERLGWIAPPAPTIAPAPQSARAAESAPAALASAAPPAPSVDEEHLKAMAADLAAMRQSVEQLAGQVASSQQQVSDEIAKLGDEIGKLQASEQDILNRIPTPPPQRPAAAPSRRPAPQPPTFAAPPPAPRVR
jgi:hypothetical protein